MRDIAMYDIEHKRDHIDRLYDIISLSTAGAATTGTTLNIAHIESAQRCLFEVIHMLATEAVDSAEDARMKRERDTSDTVSTSLTDSAA